MLTPEQEKEVKGCLENVVLNMATLRTVEVWWRLVSREHRDLFENFASFCNAARRSLPGPRCRPRP